MWMTKHCDHIQEQNMGYWLGLWLVSSETIHEKYWSHMLHGGNPPLGHGCCLDVGTYSTEHGCVEGCFKLPKSTLLPTHARSQKTSHHAKTSWYPWNIHGIFRIYPQWLLRFSMIFHDFRFPYCTKIIGGSLETLDFCFLAFATEHWWYPYPRSPYGIYEHENETWWNKKITLRT